ncbi:hypothetical protein [Shinella sp.]|uniref:hypothetical protein n=1 Tax=Shinella sp. TaxID=1870904 RepID=UPI0039E3B069
MKRRLVTVALLSTLAVASIATPSFSQMPGRDLPPIGLLLASKLAAAETYVGVTPDQLSAWHAYTAALIALVEASGPGAGDPGLGGARPQPFGEPELEHKPDMKDGKPMPLFSERLAERAAGMTDKARALQAAIETLRGTLDPDQFRRLAEAERTFAPGGHPPFPGPEERHARPD